MLSWLGNNIRELCCIWRNRRLYSQTNCRLYSTLYCCHYYCYYFRFSSHCPHAPSLSLAHSHLTHTHLMHRPIPEKGYTTLKAPTAVGLSLGHRLYQVSSCLLPRCCGSSRLLHRKWLMPPQSHRKRSGVPPALQRT